MKVLFVNACMRGDLSRTKRLCNAAIEQIKSASSADIEVFDLCETVVPPMNGEMVNDRDNLEKAGDFSNSIFDIARQFASADMIVIGAPYWEYQFPAALRCYLEHVAACGVTFGYSEEGRPYGKCKAEKLLYITTSGGPIMDRDYGFEYIKALCGGMFGIQDIRAIKAEGLDIYGAPVEEILLKAQNEQSEMLDSWGFRCKECNEMAEFDKVITIGREFGAGGRSIAKIISERLGIPYYDKDIIRMTAKESGFTEEMIEGTEEREAGRMIFNWLMSTSSASSYDQAIVAQAQTIRKLARKGPCIIVGRGADYILEDFPNVVNVFIHADLEDKMQYAIDTFGDTPDEAAKRVKHSDSARESYYHYVTKGKWGNLNNYDLTINRSPIGREACADIIINFAKNKKK